jgi:hypothetical protein
MLTYRPSMPAHLEPHQFARSALGLNVYPWQAETLAAVGKGFPSALCAVNGSGKSSTVISALLIWFLSEYPAGRCIITSGSWSQLKARLEPPQPQAFRREVRHPLSHPYPAAPKPPDNR